MEDENLVCQPTGTIKATPFLPSCGNVHTPMKSVLVSSTDGRQVRVLPPPTFKVYKINVSTQDNKHDMVMFMPASFSQEKTKSPSLPSQINGAPRSVV
mmetsp:Transcript_11207/g.23926  ORF Transcript_11207/g.23926 Transcript_11207/m.23926 type:complete len:98 (-) Transcript_11207:340-633(-)